MRNAFIVSIESYKEPITAEGLKTALYRSWDRFSGITFKVEEGGIGAIAKVVSDYLTAEEALQKYEADNDIFNNCSIYSEKGQIWKQLSDDVRLKKTAVIETLRQCGQMV